MSSNRLIYDNCEYNTKLGESVGPLEYMLNPMQYENCNKCRIELGVVGGNNVSHVKGNLVDLESDLMGVTRKASLCPSRKFKSICATSDPNNCQPANIAMTHLPSCNMFRYKPTPLPPALRLPKCPNN
jgi:hypothetical protein